MRFENGSTEVMSDDVCRSKPGGDGLYTLMQCPSVGNVLKALRGWNCPDHQPPCRESPANVRSNHGIAVPFPLKGCPPLNTSPKILRGAQGTRSNENAQGLNVETIASPLLGLAAMPLSLSYFSAAILYTQTRTNEKAGRVVRMQCRNIVERETHEVMIRVVNNAF